MRPNTSVRRPVLSGTRRHQLSDLLRSWRRQPRKRSPRLFWSLLAVAFVLDGALAFFAVQLISLAHWGESFSAERRVGVPHAQNTELWEPLRRWAIRVDAKPQLFESVCRDAVCHITGEERFENNEPLAVVVSWMLNGSAWEESPFLDCADAEIRSLLYREGRGVSRLSRQEQLHGRGIEPAVLRQSKSFRKILRGIAAKGGAVEGIRLSSLERQAVELNRRLVQFDRLRTGGVDAGEGAEMETATAALGDAYRSGSADVFAAALADFLAASRRSLRLEEDPAKARRLRLENWLNEYRPFRQAMALNLLAIGLLAVSSLVGTRRPLWRRGCLLSGLLACVGCLGWSGAGIVCQAILHEGVPVYEGLQGIICGSFLVLVLSLVLTLLYREGFIALTGALMTGCGLVLANRWPASLPATWPPLPSGGDVWLNLQVLLVIAGYAALALTWGVAALALARVLLVPPPAERLRGLANLLVRSLGITVILLAASAVIDGLRAMESNTDWHAWSTQTLGTLLVLPCCAALLYARLAGWIQPFGLVVIAVLAFTLILMGWQFVLLAAREGGIANFAGLAPILAFGLINLSLTAHAMLRYYFGKQRVEVSPGAR